jgi:mRNA interferase MazF
MIIRRGEIFLASLDPTVGGEISKTRPVIVVSNDINNKYAATVMVLPITSSRLDKIYPYEVLLPEGMANLPKTSKVKANQIRTLDRSRIVKLIGMVGEEVVPEVEKAIKLHLDLA